MISHGDTEIKENEIGTAVIGCDHVIWRFKLYHPLALQTIPFYLLVS